ncbi:hypothetical protein CDCA_CDCA08G2551 [Cyanidium caldarium]|uniref:Ubiquitin thioesterase OTU n=1 Tax=Cyanidium caldarium TaxID=2771 RepID=A0AAV9IWI8_CYACA|nr:hypothetical protein CDCA_CDCA08G2551 [Cyanidium caldarium]
MPFVQPPPVPLPLHPLQHLGGALLPRRTRLAHIATPPVPHRFLRSLLARAPPPPPPSSDGRDAAVTALRVVQTAGDGRCLFRAIAKCLAHYGQRPLPERLERADADALREAAYEEICLRRRNEFQKKGVIEGDIHAYCAELRSPEFYAGEAEMFVLSDVLQTPIEVYLYQREQHRVVKIVEYGGRYRQAADAAQPVRVLYNGVNHYSALLPQ